MIYFSMSLIIIFYILLFILWTIMGSFSGVIIERGRTWFDWKELPRIFGGRSYCPGCVEKETWWKEVSADEALKLQKKYTLKWRQLIPLVGWLIQWGKCYRCKSPIPVRYMWYEIVMWLAFVAVAYFLPWFSLEHLLMDGATVYSFLFRLWIMRASVGIITADFLRYELNVWLWLFLLLRIVWRELSWVLWNIFLPWLIWLIVLTGIFALIYWFGKRYVKKKFGQDGEGFGQGDVMMAMIVGLLFPFVIGKGWRVAGVQLTMMYLIVSSVLWMVFRWLRLIIAKNSDNTIPFLPAMMVGFVLLLVWGEILVGMLG